MVLNQTILPQIYLNLLSNTNYKITNFYKLYEDEIIRDFEKDTHTLLDAEKQVIKEDKEKDWFLEK